LDNKINNAPKGYANYHDVNQDELKNDINTIKKSIGDANWKDFEHLLKLKRWGKTFAISGLLLIFSVVFAYYSQFSISSFVYWGVGFLGSMLLAIANVARWANVAHPILHGAYDKIPNIPTKYTKDGFAKGWKRFIHWFDWIEPDAWVYEHNIMHHYHLGEADDPDNVERHMIFLHNLKIPIIFKYIFIYAFAFTWKFTFYAPNTLRILNNRTRLKNKLKPLDDCEISPFTQMGFRLWIFYILPYFMGKFIFLPLLMIPFGFDAVLSIFIFMVISEGIANMWSFMVIVPNHSAEDIYRFDTPHKSQGEYFLRQIMGSVNYNTGSDFIDFSHGFLNYQIEHHLFPNKPHSFYQKMQPLVKEVCKKHNLEYRQESVFKRALMTIELMVGKTKLLKVKSMHHEGDI
jgi:fatty acid desaturase